MFICKLDITSINTNLETNSSIFYCFVAFFEINNSGTLQNNNKPKTKPKLLAWEPLHQPPDKGFDVDRIEPGYTLLI